MNKLLIIILFFLSFNCNANYLYKIAVIDSGLNNPQTVNLCPGSQHKDFTNHGMIDILGHGTNISNLIQDNAQTNRYCQIIIKIFHDRSSDPYTMATALFYADKVGANVVNISAGGEDYNALEAFAIKKLLDKGVMVIVAAGNESNNLDKKCNWFPACYDSRILVVGNHHWTSNYGNSVVDLFENGVNAAAGGYTKTGTSQATAITSGKMIYEANRYVNSDNEENYEKAINYTSKALYKQFEIEKLLNVKLEIVKQCVPKNMQFVVGYSLHIGEILVKKKVDIVYEF